MPNINKNFEKLLKKYLVDLESWFKFKFIEGMQKSLAQNILGLIGIIIGSASSIVIFSLSFNFGLYIAKFIKPEWSNYIGYYFGISAVIPLSFLAGRTSYYVLQQFVTPSIEVDKKISNTAYQRKKKAFDILIWFIATLSAIPFFYLTHTYLFPIIKWWVIPLDIAAVIAPILVNSWALSSVSDNFIYSLIEIRLSIFKQTISTGSIALIEIHNRLNFIQYIVSRLRTKEVKLIAIKIFHNHNQQRLIDVLRLAITRGKRFKEKIPYGQTVFSYTGAIIGAISEYQYYGTGRDAALWLHAPMAIAFIVGLASLICNSTLMGYTGKIVFEQFYSWLDRLYQKYLNSEEIAVTQDFNDAHSETQWQKISNYLAEAFGNIGNYFILIIAISAATPNVYLTILQQKSMHWYNFLWLTLAFLGPFSTNFFAITRAVHQTSHRQRLNNTIAKLNNILPHLKPKYLITLRRASEQK